MLINKAEVKHPPKPKDYVNPELDTISLAVPKAEGLLTNSKGKLKFDNEVFSKW